MLVAVVTGSRGWRWPTLVWRRLDEQRARLGPGDVLVVAHGAARDGADAHAAVWVAGMQAADDGGPAVRPLPFPRQAWAAHHDGCPPGCARTVHKEHGHRRNVQMLDEAEPDVALVFMLDGPKSKGTTHCWEQVQDRRIPAHICQDWSEAPRRRRPRRAAEDGQPVPV